jgi:mono/diheme cytochrome c family protein
MRIDAAGLLFALCVAVSSAHAQGPHDEHSGHAAAPASKGPMQRVIDTALAQRGRDVYSKHCAACHGADAEGAAHWRHRGADGKFPAPPLDGSGHAWHHPMADLREMIREGSRPGEGNMPAWKDKLDDDQINAIIAWFQSLWNDDVFEAWQQIDTRARSGEP